MLKLQIKQSYKLILDILLGITYLTSIVYRYYYLTKLLELETLSLNRILRIKITFSITLVQVKLLNKR